jgi:signal transduction histidine kinase
MVVLNFPAAWIHHDLFNPQIFASSFLNASLGDLLLNELALLVLCYYIFKHYAAFFMVRLASRYRIARTLLSVFAAIVMLFSTLYPFVVIQTLFNNSSIAIDISQSLTSDTLRVIAFIIILLAGICAFLVTHAFARMLIGDGNLKRIVPCLFAGVIIFVSINLYTGQPFESSLVTAVLYFIIVYVLRLYASLRHLNFATFAYLFTTVFFFSANAAYGIQYFSHKEKIEDQFRFASNYLVDRDVFGEYLLAEAAREIAADAFIQTRLTSVFLSRNAIRQKIRQVFLPVYFNKYDVDIFLFNATGESLNGYSTRTFPELIAQYDKDAYRTSHTGVYFVNDPVGDVAQQYLVKIPISRGNAISGYIVLKLSLKKIIPESVYPELLVDNQMQQYYRAQNFSYAVLEDGVVLFRSGSFNYEQQFNWSWLGNKDIHFTGMTMNGYDHVAQEDESGRVAIVSSEQLPVSYKLANFSFLMVLGLVIMLLFIVGQGALNYWRGQKLYFAARIQLFMNLAFFLPLIIVSILTIQLINKSSQNQLNEEYLAKARTAGDQLVAKMSGTLEDNPERTAGFENQVTGLAKLSSVDLNVYTSRGVLMATSQPMIFANGLLSDFVNAKALQRIRRGDNLFIETEQVGTLTYFVSYTTLKSPVSGNLIGILGIPFFRSGVSLEKMQINILVNILNLFTLIFIALIVLAYFVSKWLTFPLDFITQSLRKTSLTKTNQPLVWKSEDEIGLMVKEYNRMLYNLSESKAELEQNQRERTWREMAQQVAHEIKNPLTPMKLSLQQLERNLANGTLSDEKTSKAVSSLLTQVDTLNDIASSFSTFAKLPEPVIHPLDVVGLMKRIVDLHSHTGDIQFRPSFRELYVQGDEQLLGRAFSNIILNAFQAARPGQSSLVTISIQKQGINALIALEDNGKGIEPAQADRIFVPHFTTKKTGSGLGLAITRQAIEQMKGRIWFETVVDKGTTFFIELPLVS